MIRWLKFLLILLLQILKARVWCQWCQLSYWNGCSLQVFWTTIVFVLCAVHVQRLQPHWGISLMMVLNVSLRVAHDSLGTDLQPCQALAQWARGIAARNAGTCISSPQNPGHANGIGRKSWTITGPTLQFGGETQNNLDLSQCDWHDPQWDWSKPPLINFDVCWTGPWYCSKESPQWSLHNGDFCWSWHYYYCYY